MANPLFQQQQQNSSPIAEIISLYKAMVNPSQLVQNNPQLQSILSIYNGDAKSAFYSLCQQKGIDPNQIINYFR